MSKYELLWKYLKENNKDNYKLSYGEIKIFGKDYKIEEKAIKEDIKEF